MSIITEEAWTTEKVIDEIHLCLIKVTVCVTNGKGETMEVKKYELKAEELIYRIPIHIPIPVFIVEKSDLTNKIRKELEESTSIEWRQHVLKRAVGRIFEEIDYDYYHQSVAPLLKVRLV